MHSRYFRNVKLFISKDVEKARLVFEMVEGHIFVIKWGYFRAANLQGRTYDS